VASKTTGQFVARMIDNDLMSDTSVL
jgi:hypothetical protein